MISGKIKYELTEHEIKYILNIINSFDKFSYELAQISYEIDYIEYLMNQKDFVCVFFYEINDVNDEVNDEVNDKVNDQVNDQDQTDIEEKELDEIKAFVLGKKVCINQQPILNKLKIKLTNDNSQNVKDFEKIDCLFVDYIGINAKNKFSLLKDIKYNLQFNFQNCLYKLNKDITYSFSKKYYYYRPINLDIIKELNILSKNILTDTFTKVYKTYSYPKKFNDTKSIILNPVITEDEVKLICYKINNSNKKNFEIYREITEDEIYNIFNFKGDLFYKFLIYNEYNELSDVVILMKNKYNEECKNVDFYIGMFENNNSQYKYDILEFICYYASHYKLFDMMTIVDDISSKKLNTKFLKSIKKEYQYESNLNFEDYDQDNINLN